MIQNARKRLLIIAVVAIVIILAVVSAWLYSLSPAERESTLRKIRMITVKGALQGGMLTLLALGFTLSYGVADVTSMSHGSLYMTGAYLFLAFAPITLFQLGLLPAIILAAFLAGIISILVYVSTIHPILRDRLAVLVVSVGVAVIFQQVMMWKFTTNYRGVPILVSEKLRLTVLGVGMTYAWILAFAASLGLFAAVWIFITKSKIGKAMRAVAQDHEMAMLTGVNTMRLYMLTMGISGSLAALAGIFITGSVSLVAQPYMWLTPLALSFSIVILGGLGSIEGTFIGAFIVGFAETAVGILFPGGAHLKGVAALAIMVLILVVRPKGLFGKRIELEE